MNIGDILNKAEEVQNEQNVHEKRKKLKEEREAENRKLCYQILRDALKQIQHDFDSFVDVNINPYVSSPSNGGYSVYKYGYRTFKPRFSKGKYDIDDTFLDKESAKFCGNVLLVDGTNDDDAYWRSDMKLQIQVNNIGEDKELKFIFNTKYYKFIQAEEYLNIEKGKHWVNNPLKEYSRVFSSYIDFKEYLTGFLTDIVNIDSLKKKHGLFIEEVEKVTRIG